MERAVRLSPPAHRLGLGSRCALSVVAVSSCLLLPPLPRNLFRRTGYALALDPPPGFGSLLGGGGGGGGRRADELHPLGDCDGVYTPELPILRAGEEEGYAVLPPPHACLSFVAGGRAPACLCAAAAVLTGIHL